MQQQPLQEVQNRPTAHQQLHSPSKQHLHSTGSQQGSSSSTPMQQASTQDLLPVFDLSDFLALPDGQEPSPALLQQCKQLADCLVKTGCLVVRAAASTVLIVMLRFGHILTQLLHLLGARVWFARTLPWGCASVKAAAHAKHNPAGGWSQARPAQPLLL